MTATKTIVIYNSEKKIVIAEVFEGEKYYLPTNENQVKVYEGTLENFINNNPDYELS